MFRATRSFLSALIFSRGICMLSAGLSYASTDAGYEKCQADEPFHNFNSFVCGQDHAEIVSPNDENIRVCFVLALHLVLPSFSVECH
jgi:hypothetical protein